MTGGTVRGFDPDRNGSHVDDRRGLTGEGWRTSSFSGGGGGACVQVAPVLADSGGAAGLAVRDSKNPTGGTLAFAPNAWASFLDAVRAGTVPTI